MNEDEKKRDLVLKRMMSKPHETNKEMQERRKGKKYGKDKQGTKK